MHVFKYFVSCGNRVQLTVGLLLGGRAFAVAGETPAPSLVSFDLFKVEDWLGGTCTCTCARLLRATPHRRRNQGGWGGGYSPPPPNILGRGAEPPP